MHTFTCDIHMRLWHTETMITEWGFKHFAHYKAQITGQTNAMMSLLDYSAGQ